MKDQQFANDNDVNFPKNDTELALAAIDAVSETARLMRERRTKAKALLDEGLQILETVSVENLREVARKIEYFRYQVEFFDAALEATPSIDAPLREHLNHQREVLSVYFANEWQPPAQSNWIAGPRTLQ